MFKIADRSEQVSADIYTLLSCALFFRSLSYMGSLGKTGKEDIWFCLQRCWLTWVIYWKTRFSMQTDAVFTFILYILRHGSICCTLRNPFNIIGLGLLLHTLRGWLDWLH